MYNNKDSNERYKDLCGRLVCWLGESEEGAELYATLHTAIGMTDDEICEIGFTSLAPYFTEHQDDDYDENISRERDELLAGCLKPGDEVLFVATIPYGGEGDFALRGGIIRGVDADNRMCSVKGEFFTMDDVPLHYVLGKYNPEVSGEHYGFKNVEPLFGEHPVLAQKYLREAEEAWEQKCNPDMNLSV